MDKELLNEITTPGSAFEKANGRPKKSIPCPVIIKSRILTETI